uniref:SKP1 component dimerisation domain-containing protein n=1 Tax=Panagrolaimus sp. JU765 TaxID=591449 RepID=A0AC34QRR6_9BILA
MPDAGDGQTFSSIPENTPLEYKLKFQDGKEVQLTEHVRILAGGIKDLLHTPFEKDAAIPVPQQDLTAECFELLIKICKAVQEKEPRLYLRYLNHEEVKEEANKEHFKLFEDYPDDVIIRAANATAFFSFTLPRRIICAYLGSLVNKLSVLEIRRLFGATPLDKDTCDSYGLDEHDSIWDQYPDIKRSIFG